MSDLDRPRDAGTDEEAAGLDSRLRVCLRRVVAAGRRRP